MVNVTPRPPLPPGKARYPLYRRLGGPQGQSRQVRKISTPPRFDPRTFQPVASCYTDWAIAACLTRRLKLNVAVRHFSHPNSQPEVSVVVCKPAGLTGLHTPCGVSSLGAALLCACDAGLVGLRFPTFLLLRLDPWGRKYDDLSKRRAQLA